MGVFQVLSGSLKQGEDLDKHLSILAVDSVPSHVAPAQDAQKYSTEEKMILAPPLEQIRGFSTIPTSNNGRGLGGSSAIRELI